VELADARNLRAYNPHILEGGRTASSYIDSVQELEPW